MDNIQWKGAAAEGIATALFVFMGAGAVVMSGVVLGGGLDPARLIAIALAHGLAIALLVSATAHLSGGHINPAVTIAALITKRISAPSAAAFIIAQLAGAAVGAALIAYITTDLIGGGFGNGAGTLGAHGLGNGINEMRGLVVEIVLTFVLVFVVFATAMDKRGTGNVAPLFVGLAILVIHLVAVPLTGAGVNPARSFGPALMAEAWTDHWIYWVGPIIGASLAGVGYKMLFQGNSND